jgi:hypothetical protein
MLQALTLLMSIKKDRLDGKDLGTPLMKAVKIKVGKR